MTTPGSSLSTCTLAALRDELEKIADATSARERALRERRRALKKYVKNTLMVAGGYGAGHGAAMLIEKGLEKRYGKAWASLPAQSKARFLKPALGIGTAASLLAARHLKRSLKDSNG